MASKRICAQCLRTLRRDLQTERVGEQSRHRRTAQGQHVRGFSTRPALLQQQQQQQQQQKPSKDSSSFPSSSQMQKAITSRLASRSDLTTSLARTLRRTAVKTTETYITYGQTESLFKACSAQADYFIPEDQRLSLMTGEGPNKTAGGEDLGIPAEGREHAWWFRELGLPPTFSTWSQVAYLHMYLLTVRLRALESSTSFQNYQRYLLEHFSHEAEDKMIILHNMAARGVRNQYLKDLFLQWRGILAAYDEGMINGDPALAGAVWRNLYKGDENVDWTKVASVVAWMRSVVSVLGKVEVEELVGGLEGRSGLFEIGRTGSSQLVAQKSRGLAEPLA